jgi:hypothetical protein
MEFKVEFLAGHISLVLPGPRCRLIEDRIPGHDGASRRRVEETPRLGAPFIAYEDHRCVTIIELPQVRL